MKLSKNERIILINQYKILSYLDEDKDADYEERIKILENGFENEYLQCFEEVSSETMHEDQGKLVQDILNLYFSIEIYQQEYHDPDITANKFSKFIGFDSHSELQYKTYANFLINKENSYDKLKPCLAENNNCDSHCPMIPKYIKMIESYKNVKQAPLNKTQILEILESS